MVYICTDLWTDSTARPFNGFIAQGIDNEWKLQTLPIEFEYIEGIKIMLCLVFVNKFVNFYLLLNRKAYGYKY